VDRAVVDGISLEYEDSGIGEPVVCIHGAFIADTFRPLASELPDRYRLIRYHRRGYAGSSRVDASVLLAEQAADCRSLLSYLGVRRAHVVGHSFGGAVGLQLALDAPQVVHTLTVLEPGLAVGESASSYRQALEDSARRYRQAGAEIAVGEFLQARGPDSREQLERVLPGAFEQAVADAATSFDVDLPTVLESRFGVAEAGRIAQPVLVVMGEASAALHPRFVETHRLLLSWLPNAEELVIPHAAHLMQLENPRALADGLAEFYGRHPLGGTRLRSGSALASREEPNGNDEES
jgi:pimeloyl-ACP methyl ester carboxylesterase